VPPKCAFTRGDKPPMAEPALGDGLRCHSFANAVPTPHLFVSVKLLSMRFP